MIRVLIVDDEKINRQILRLLVLKSNYPPIEVVEAENGEEAVAIVKKGGIDLVLMDIMMPLMSGIEATKQIKKYRHDLMVIAVSALDDE
ncbi:MAG: response regulator, partial [Campylobacterales bacterium]